MSTPISKPEEIQLLYRPATVGLDEGVLGQITVTDSPQVFYDAPVEQTSIADQYSFLQLNLLKGDDAVATLSCAGVRHDAKLSDVYDFADKNLFGVPATRDPLLSEALYAPIAQELRDALPGISNVTMQVANRTRKGKPITRNETLESIRRAAVDGMGVNATGVFEGSNPLEKMCDRIASNPALEPIRTRDHSR